MKPSDELIIDKRSTDDLRGEVSRLAASFVPEWRFCTDHPDVGSTIALIYTNQLADNIARLNRLPEKYQTEFSNLLGVSLLPAYPASGIVVAELAGDTIDGVPLPHGTKLLGAGEGEEPLIFETVNDLYVTVSKLTDVVSISPKLGKIIPILGGPKAAELLPAGPSEEESSRPAEDTVPPFSLFDYDSDGVEQNALLMFHESIFDAGDGISIYLRPTAADGSSLAAEFADSSRYRFLRRGEEGLVPMDEVLLDGDTLVLTQSEKSIPVRLDGKDYFVLCLERLTPVEDNVSVSDLRISSICGDCAPDFVLHGSDELEVASFKPFGDSCAMYDECCIGADRLFSQKGADVRIHFNLKSEDKLVTFSAQQEADALKIIKRKPQTVLFETVTTCPESVSLEYYNGLGWRKLACKSDCSALFDGKTGGDCVISFTCPEDWEPSAAGGFHARMLRLRIMQADNCYLQPCVHTMPVISGMCLSCAYESEWKQPSRLKAVRGTQTQDFGAALSTKQPFAAFSPLPYGCNALYLGLDTKPAGSPISILFDAAESVLPDDVPLTFEYSTGTGFKPLKVIDGTKSLTRSGTVVFMPPSDFAAAEVEGVSRFWLRLTDTAELSGRAARFRPVISRLLMNAVEIRNQQTLPEESFFIEAAAPNMRFPIAAGTIYRADVYVSELPRFSPSAMEQMARQMPERVRISHDLLGNITSFFVLWDEAENFDSSKPTDRHYVLDRMNNTISFGDGVHVLIPPAQRGAAFTVSAVCCNGQAGNLPAGAVNTMFDGAMYIGNVYNPIATFGGSDLETVASAQERGATIVCGRNRLISELDYVREVYAFSDAVEKVRCVSGCDIWGREAPGLVTVAVMSRDYADGAYSFTGLHDALMARLLSRCEATITEETLSLCEPCYVRVSLDVWVQVENAALAFDAQSQLLEHITDFLDPIGRNGRGWDMGVLPSSSQLRQMLYSLRFRGLITKYIVTARYVDEAGPHETDLDSLPANPFAIVINGTHHVFMELENH